MQHIALFVLMSPSVMRLIRTFATIKFQYKEETVEQKESWGFNSSDNEWDSSKLEHQ